EGAAASAVVAAGSGCVTDGKEEAAGGGCGGGGSPHEASPVHSSAVAREGAWNRGMPHSIRLAAAIAMAGSAAARTPPIPRLGPPPPCLPEARPSRASGGPVASPARPPAREHRPRDPRHTKSTPGGAARALRSTLRAAPPCGARRPALTLPP